VCRGRETALPAEPLTVCRCLADLAPEWRPATPADPVAAISVADQRVALCQPLQV